MKILGALLIVVGLLGVVYGGLSFTRKDKVVEVGPITVTTDKTERIPVSPLAGGLALVAGIVLVVRSGRA